jgi:omega-amidase
MKVYCVQHDIAWEDKPVNFATVRRLLSKTPPEPGSLVLLAEMFAVGFSLNIQAIAEEEGGPTHAFLRSLATEHRCHVLGGVVTRGTSNKGRNQAIACSPDGALIARYQKLHPFTPGGETANYEPGQSLSHFAWHDFHVTPFICYDLRFPESFRPAAQTTTLFPVIASWPFPRDQHWIKLLQARAIENQAFVAGVNRCGTDPRFRYPGRSLIVDYQGNILADAGDGEAVISGDLDIDALRRYRRDLPFLADILP